jgi:hypothetical protein
MLNYRRPWKTVESRYARALLEIRKSSHSFTCVLDRVWTPNASFMKWLPNDSDDDDSPPMRECMSSGIQR